MHHQKIEAEYSWLQPPDKGSMFIDKTKNRGDFKLRETESLKVYELVGHKIARLNRKSVFYLNHHPLVHFLSDRSQQKVNLHYSLFQQLRFQMSIKKG